MTFEQAADDIQSLLDQLMAEDSDFRAELELPPASYQEPWRAQKVPMPALETDPSEPIVRTVASRHEYVTGQEPHVGIEMPGSHAGTDAGHLSAAGTKAVIYGPTSNAFAQSQVELDRLLICSKVLALTALDMCGDV
jgi:acetylornithine deacetylase/succinyl-diaminopimelate desuccinylase-like protein